MADIFSIISSGYSAASLTLPSATKYVAVDPATYEGTWSGKYSNNSSFAISISNVSGFRARVRYESGSTVQFQDVLIKDSSFRIGDTKFTLAGKGTAQVKTVVTDPAYGTNTLQTAYAKQDT